MVFEIQELSQKVPLFRKSTNSTLNCFPKGKFQIRNSLKQTPTTAKVKILNKYPDLLIDWKKWYSLAFETMLDTKLREFQHKILNLIIFTNEKLHCFKMVDSPLCAFCNAEVASLEPPLHLHLVDCSGC